MSRNVLVHCRTGSLENQETAQQSVRAFTAAQAEKSPVYSGLTFIVQVIEIGLTGGRMAISITFEWSISFAAIHGS